MATYSLTIPITDALSTAVGELQWQVRTASGTGGALLASGAATSGTPVNTGTINDPTLVTGDNTRWVRVIDGAGNIANPSFTVTADLSVEIEASVAGQATVTTSLSTVPQLAASISGTADVDATLSTTPQLAADIAGSAAVNAHATAPALITADISGNSTTAATLTTGAQLTANIAGQATVTTDLRAGHGLQVRIHGQATVNANLSTPAYISANIAGSSDVQARVTITPEIAANISGSATTDAHLTTPAQMSAEILSWSTVNATLSTVPQLSADIDGSADVDGTLSTVPQIRSTISGTADVLARVTIIPEIVAEIHGQATTKVTLLTTAPIRSTIRGQATVSARLLQRVTTPGNRLRADIHDLNGTKIAPLATILSADYEESLDGVGTFALEIPAIDPMAEHVVAGNEVRLYREGEGLLFRGIIDGRETMVDASGNLTLSITGDSLARQLVWANTYLGRQFANQPMATAVNTLLSGTGWTANTVQGDTRNLTAQFDGVSIWAALVHAAEMFGWHVRERNLSRQIDVGKLGASSGLIMRNVEHVTNDMAVLPITRLRLEERQEELWNRVLPIGGGEGVNVLTLRHSNRSSPYTIKSAAGPGGTFWYIEDTASIATHGLRTKVLSVKDIVPLSNSPAEIRNAANTLYDVAAAWLGWHSQLQESYQVDITGLKHMENGQPRFRVGDTLRLVYKGVVEDEGEKRLWRSVDRDVWIMGYERRFNSDGSDGWSFRVSTTDRETPTDADTIAKALEDLWAIKTASRPYTYREIHGPFVESVASGQNAHFLVDFDSNVTYLHQAILRVRKRRVKSNVTGAASGGGMTVPGGTPQTALSGGTPTSQGGGSHSHSVSVATTPSGGGHTSTASGSHTHSVSGGTTVLGGDHKHLIADIGTPSTWSTPSHIQQMIFADLGGSPFGVYLGRNGSSQGAFSVHSRTSGQHSHTVTGIAASSVSNHSHGILNHTHTVSGQTAATVSNHTHSIASHTHPISSHTHELPSHQHALIYGIFLGPTASSPQMRVLINGTDRTAALGGPWNNDFTADITQFLVDGQGHPLRQANNIEISASQLMDAEVVVRTFCTSHSVVPV